METPQQRAVGYIRVSQVGGRGGDSFLSPDVQREKIEAWAGYRGYRIVDWYIDLDRPAKETDQRPEFERMMTDAAAGRFDAVAVYRLTRFARSVSQAAARYADLQRHHVDLVSVTEDFDTSTSSGRLVQNMLFALAEFESQRIGEEWRNVHAARRRRGIAHVARPMLGYQIEGAEIVAVDESEAEAVRAAFELRAAGAGYGTIRAQLERRGHRPKRGGAMFPISSLKDILANPTYAGLVRLDDELLPGQHDAIVSRELWDAVQARRAPSAATARFHAALLSGLVVCAGCGYRMRHEHRATKPAVYRCNARQRSERCERSSTIAVHATDAHVEALFLRRFDPRWMPNRGRLRQSRQRQRWDTRAASLRRRADELSRALDALADARYVKGSLQEGEYHRQFDRYAAERAQTVEEADQLEQRSARLQPVDVDILSVWPTLDLETKQRALRLQIERVLVKPAPSQGGARNRGVAVGKRLEVAWID